MRDYVAPWSTQLRMEGKPIEDQMNSYASSNEASEEFSMVYKLP